MAVRSALWWVPRCGLVVAVIAMIGFAIDAAGAQEKRREAQVNSIADMFATLKGCWRPPTLPQNNRGMQITVLVSFKRDGTILGQPKITFESKMASDDDRIAYRRAVMDTLQRCVPIPFTEAMGGAIAGRPVTLRFDDRRNSPQPTEKRAWLTTTTL